jgi:DNA modification methylase
MNGKNEGELKMKILIGDCREVLKKLPDKSFDLAILDPPYYKIVKNAWDNQWKTFDEYLDWLEGICLEVKRVLKDNGSMYVFGDDHRIAYVQTRLDRHFTFLNHLIWYKRNNYSIKGAYDARRFACVSERILFYSLQDPTRCGNFTNIRNYLLSEKEKSGLTLTDLNEILTGIRKSDLIAKRYFGVSEWNLPTREMYEKLQTTGLFQREYDDLRREYESLRRPFNYINQMYEVFDVPIINCKENTYHPTTKPIELFKRLISCSTNEDSIVLDPFAGSGTTGAACNQLGRDAFLIELNPEYKPLIEERINSRLAMKKLSKKKTTISHLKKTTLQQNLVQYMN